MGPTNSPLSTFRALSFVILCPNWTLVGRILTSLALRQPPLVVTHAYTDVGEGGDEGDTDSDYEEEPTDSMKVQTDGSVQAGSIPDHGLLPGAFTT